MSNDPCCNTADTGTDNTQDKPSDCPFSGQGLIHEHAPPRATQWRSSGLIQTGSKSCLDCTRRARHLSLAPASRSMLLPKGQASPGTQSTREPSSVLSGEALARVSYPPAYTLHDNPDRPSLLPEKFGRLGRDSDKKLAAVTD